MPTFNASARFSVAILRYLVKSRHLEDNWYPSDLKRQARVDEYLEWQHNNTRALCTMYFRVKVSFWIKTEIRIALELAYYEPKQIF